MRNDFSTRSFSYEGTLIGLLNPYGLLTGALFVMLFAVHGALFLTIKTPGGLAERAGAFACRLWPALLVVAVLFLGYTYPATKLYGNFLKYPVLSLIPIIAVISLLMIRVFTGKGAYGKAFLFSCLTILFVVFTGVAGLFPNLLPSNIDPASNLTIFISSSSLLTLKIMTGVALVMVPIIIVYKIWVYRIFRAPVRNEDVLT